MELTNKILDTALLSELAYLRLENKYFKDEDYSLKNIEKRGQAPFFRHLFFFFILGIFFKR